MDNHRKVIRFYLTEVGYKVTYLALLETFCFCFI